MERNKRRKRRGKKWKRIGKRRRRDRQLTARSNFSDLSRPRPRRVIQLRQPSWKGRGNTHRVRAPRPSIDPPTLSISRIPRPRFSITPVFQPLSPDTQHRRIGYSRASLASPGPLSSPAIPRVRCKRRGCRCARGGRRRRSEMARSDSSVEETRGREGKKRESGGGDEGGGGGGGAAGGREGREGLKQEGAAEEAIDAPSGPYGGA